MKAMILAAGKGTRMREYTEKTPKPLLRANGKALIEYQLEALVRAGVSSFIINHARFGDQIESYLGNGSRWGVQIQYSKEGEEPLETAGGIIKALPLLGQDPFIAVNADVWTDFDYSRLFNIEPKQACIVLVENPPHNKQGDFSFEGGRVKNEGPIKYTFSGIGVYRPSIFSNLNNESKLSLTPILRNIADLMLLDGLIHTGGWLDIGTPERLMEFERQLKSN